MRRLRCCVLCLAVLTLPACADCSDEIALDRLDGSAAVDAGRPDTSPPDARGDVGGASWVRQYGGNALDFAEAVALAPDGSTYVVGAWGERDAATEAVVRAYSARGELAWEDRFGAEEGAWALDVADDGDAIYVVGRVSTDMPQAFVRRYESDGEVVWTRQFGTDELRSSYPQHVGDSAAAVDVYRGEVYVAGGGDSFCCGSRYFDHPWVAKFDGKGERKWVAMLEGGWVANDLEISDAGVFLAGDTDTRRDVNWSGWDAVVARLTLDGEPQWRRRFDVDAALGPDIAFSLVAEGDSAFLAAWGPDYNTASAPTYLLLEFDSSGEVAWSQRSPHPVTQLAGDRTLLYAAGSSDAPPMAAQSRLETGEAGVRVTGYAPADASSPVCDFGTLAADRVSAIDAVGGRLALAGTTDGVFPGESFAGERDAFVGNLLMPDPDLPDVVACLSGRGGVLRGDERPAPGDQACPRDLVVAHATLGEHGGEPVVMGSRVYFGRRVDGHAQIFTRSAYQQLSERRVTRDPADYRLLAAGGTRLLVSSHRYRRTRGEPASRLEVLEASGRVVASLPSLRLYTNRTRPATASRSFDGQRVLTREDNDLRVWSVLEGELGGVELSDAHRLSSRAVLTPDGFAYAAAEMTDGPPFVELAAADVFAYDPQRGRRQLTDTPEDERHVWADGDSLYWVTAKGAYKKDGDASAELLQQGRCGPPHAADGVVAFACAADGAGSDAWGEPVASQLYMHDGEQTRRIELRGERALIHAVRVSSSGIAWLEFDVATALCHGHTPGRVMYYDFETERHARLGEVLAPCLCCETSGPRPHISLGHRLAAWTWAQRDERTEYGTTRGVDYATAQFDHCDR